MKASRILNIVLAVVVIILTINIIIQHKEPSISEQTTPKNAALENIFSRKSVRSYTSRKVEREQLDILVRAGMSAPTAVNKQPWAFVIIDSREILDSLAAGLSTAKMLGNANAAIVVCGDTDKALLERDQAYWVQDCSAASENILLAAEAIGLGAVWTGVFPRVERIEVVKRVLNLPENIIPLNVIPIGYPLNPNEQPKDKYKPGNIFFNAFR